MSNVQKFQQIIHSGDTAKASSILHGLTQHASPIEYVILYYQLILFLSSG